MCMPRAQAASDHRLALRPPRLRVGAAGSGLKGGMGSGTDAGSSSPGAPTGAALAEARAKGSSAIALRVAANESRFMFARRRDNLAQLAQV
jgi:hypothetical protein